MSKHIEPHPTKSNHIQLTPHQQTAFHHLQTFLNDPHHRVFLLKGYAGTGKTTLAKFLLEHLRTREDLEPVLLASTGRAAKVLQRKTGTGATTVHSCIYAFDHVDDGNAPPDQVRTTTTATDNCSCASDYANPAPTPRANGDFTSSTRPVCCRTSRAAATMPPPSVRGVC